VPQSDIGQQRHEDKRLSRCPDLPWAELDDLLRCRSVHELDYDLQHAVTAGLNMQLPVARPSVRESPPTDRQGSRIADREIELRIVD
jgi:hypothetical protein